ncbi:glucose dehydrogenase [FAD, quinone]-like [Homalodisca vitripennis]|uniref:glucose dehydrogenase [FAD, quinone]-like n=1 Tax=Homalodisca vitripennis TaxID=197043 RepID=UPI001EEC409F|nr:glucose dehydrogenase [FAD, quinone]-like [Homalodisca vitripennis]
MANRLTENPDWNVLLLEAGGNPTVTTEVPGLAAAVVRTDLDWQYQTEPDPSNCQGSANKSCYWPRGKMLGGSSSINAMLYVRGNPKDFDDWENMGNPGWSYKDMLPYFQKSEDLRSETVLKNRQVFRYHNKGGYLKIESFKRNINFFTDLFSKGFHELSYQSFSDVNAEHHEGFFLLQGTLENARRCSTAKAFLRDFQKRPNLKISTNSLVLKVLINDKNTAYGVEFSKKGKILRTLATKEVILSAGSINSPQLLMLSGIGPRRHLNKLGIKVVQNSKVGYNLQDHTIMRGFIVTLDIHTSTPDPIESMFQFLINSRGEFSGPNFLSIAGFIKTSQAKSHNIQFYFTSQAANSSTILQRGLRTFGYDEVIVRSLVKINANNFVISITPSLVQPKSRGRILLKSTNPFDHPLIYPRYFSEEQDIVENLEAIEFANKLVNTDALKRFNARVQRIDIPECNVFQFQSEPYWRCVIKYMSVTVYHPVGTCRMGPRGDRDSVVDPQLRVIGISSLRVVDGSVMPKITSGNTNAPIIAVAEKASDLIKNHWGFC